MKFWSLCLLSSLALGAGFNTYAAEGDAAFAVSPESAYSLVQTAIADAQSSISLNIYMLTNRNVADALAAKAKAGVKVTILLEGQTFGDEILLPVKKVLDDFEAKLAGTSARFLVMTSQAGGKRRYVFDHAKYMVIDGTRVFVSSENITGSAYNNRNQTGGTRGWEIYVENAALGSELSQVFATDTDLSYHDVIPYAQVQWNVKDPGNNPLPPRKDRTVPSFAMARGRVSEATLCSSPNSLQCMIDFIRSAKSDLALEHLSLPKVWVDHQANTSGPSPVVDEIVAAAKRGVRVRVLLNDDNSFADNGGTAPEEKNAVTISYLQQMAAQSRLPIQAATLSNANVQVSYVHNKGMVADGSRVFVSSINGTQNAIMNNREVAVAVASPDAAAYFGKVFDTDWQLSAK
jgi:cardiolipin synthase